MRTYTLPARKLFRMRTYKKHRGVGMTTAHNSPAGSILWVAL